MSPGEYAFYMGTLPADTLISGKVVAPFVAEEPTPKSDIIHSLEDNMSVMVAPDPDSIMTAEQLKEYEKDPRVRAFYDVAHRARMSLLRARIEARHSKLRDPHTCAHERQRFVTRWRCTDCGIYL